MKAKFLVAALVAALGQMQSSSALAACSGPFTARALASFGLFARAGDHAGGWLVIPADARCTERMPGGCIFITAQDGPPAPAPAYSRPDWIKTSEAETYDRARADILRQIRVGAWSLYQERLNPRCSAAEWGMMQLDVRLLQARAKELSTLTQQANGAPATGPVGG
jgi:hypothetical protein